MWRCCFATFAPAAAIADIPDGPVKELRIEHPIGATTVQATMSPGGGVAEAAILRTARKLFDGTVFAAAAGPG